MARFVADALARCLQAIERGEMTPAECLVRYPAHQDELGPLLETAALLRSASTVAPGPAFRGTARRRLLNRLGKRQPATFWSRLFPKWQLGRRPAFSRKVAAVLALIWVALVVLLGGGGGVVSASSRALPGDTLYAVKTASEEVRLAFSDDVGDFRLYLEFAEARVQEMERLVVAGRFGGVPVAAGRFEDQVRGAADALARVGADEAPRAKGLVAQYDEAVSAHIKRLTGLLEAAPDQVRPAIERALIRAVGEADPVDDGPSAEELQEPDGEEEDPDRSDDDMEQPSDEDADDEAGDESSLDDDADSAPESDDESDADSSSDLDDDSDSDDDKEDVTSDSDSEEDIKEHSDDDAEDQSDDSSADSDTDKPDGGIDDDAEDDDSSDSDSSESNDESDDDTEDDDSSDGDSEDTSDDSSSDGDAGDKSDDDSYDESDD